MDFDIYEGLANETRYRGTITLGPSVSLVSMYTQDDETQEILGYEYWVEIEGIKIPSTIGYANTEKSFRQGLAISLRTFIGNILSDSAKVL
jgi:hypothetical protein